MTVPFDGCPFESSVRVGPEAIEPRHARLFRVVKDRVATLYSVNIDEACRPAYPRSLRWDYGIWYVRRARRPETRIIFAEVHKAEAGEVSVVIGKRRWLEDLLSGVRLPPESWFWIPSGRQLIPKNSTQYRRLVQSGIRLVSRVDIPTE